ncbi:MAG: hypothetical protein IH905_17725 [Proteobacteria bacterium]|nr:hypothetical protein [Pseudomonadota bacterium]
MPQLADLIGIIAQHKEIPVDEKSVKSNPKGVVEILRAARERMSVGVRLETAFEEAVERGDKTKVAHLFDEARNNIVAQLKGVPVADFRKILRLVRNLFKTQIHPRGN